MIGTNRDITERKLAEAARRDLEAQLRESQKMEAIGTLARGIAHDFNNILGAILGNVALAREEVGPGHAACSSLEQTQRAAQRARSLVQQILAFSRNQPQELQNRPLRPLVEDALRLMRATLPAGVAIEPRLAEAPPESARPGPPARARPVHSQLLRGSCQRDGVAAAAAAGAAMRAWVCAPSSTSAVTSAVAYIRRMRVGMALSWKVMSGPGMLRAGRDNPVKRRG